MEPIHAESPHDLAHHGVIKVKLELGDEIRHEQGQVFQFSKNKKCDKGHWQKHDEYSNQQCHIK
jgi:hypothetical protein